ncbi:hypothetical protein OEG84_09455 [Hoeflea sp. G2-23]|uniref:Uncharacterized protein n=1 Tax=Hoeflea algicola TaxID=2983763 RepID=A0ABT3Z825_9HYPH|nr:hypothetical protein [Hoeflea algicola]MCY0147930.1 hypothetical protein [Hoeflea algicola]
MKDTFSIWTEKVPDGYIDGAVDILEELEANPGKFDYDIMRAGYLADGYPPEKVEQILRAIGYEGDEQSQGACCAEDAVL